MLNQTEQKVLEKARKTYGDKNQIMVCIEELNELGCVLAKYPRYEYSARAVHELFDKVLDETADVYIILEHVKSIFGISEDVLTRREELKVERMNRWLSHSDSQEETMRDRAVNTEE